MADMFELIHANKRNSVVLAVGMTLLVLVVGGVFGAVFGSWQVGLGIALVVTVLMLVGSWYGGASAVLAMSGARAIRKADDPRLFNVVEELAIAAGIPMPKVYLINDPAPNAFATGRDPEHAAVAITTGLRQKLNRDELQGVMAHEMSHVRNYDIRFAMLMAVMVGVIVLLCDFFWRAAFYGSLGRSRRSSRSNEGGGGVQAIIIIAAVVLAILAPIFAMIIQLAVSRQREYLADASAAELTRYPDGLARALLKISGDPSELAAASRATQHLYIVSPLKAKASGRSAGLFSTHPPIHERVARLRAIGMAA